jgi:hypothetical protein
MTRRAVVPAAGVVLAAAYWLFADTVRYWTGAGAAAIRFSFWGGFDDLRMWERIIADFERARAGSAGGDGSVAFTGALSTAAALTRCRKRCILAGRVFGPLAGAATCVNRSATVTERKEPSRDAGSSRKAAVS